VTKNYQGGTVIFHAIKDFWRRRQLRRRGIVAELSIPTLSAGDRSGVWVVAPELLARDSVVYSFGVGDNLTWELALAARFDLTVHAFDPTPASMAWVAQQSLPPNIQFHPIGLADRDGTMRFAPRRRESRINYRPLSLTAEPGLAIIEAHVARLVTHMHLLGHDHIDVLKIDIEGGEYPVLDDLLASRLQVRQLLVEFHHHFPGVGIEATERSVQALRAAGYQIFHISDRGLEFSLLHRLD